ncbi:MAG: hypothetical protein Q4D71_10695 [Oscillospiraceae bacterium]|nr:hypothetical protein [Oscillospiraceae bacterium]
MPEDGNTTDAQMPEGAEITEDGEEITDSVDSSAVETTDQAAPEETSSKAEAEIGEEAETQDNTSVPTDETGSFDSSDETEDVSSGITDNGEMISDEMPSADQKPQEDSAPAQEDNALTEDQAAADNPDEILENPGAEETVSEEQAADGEERFNPIDFYDAYLDLSPEVEEKINIAHGIYSYDYNYEYIKSAESSDNSVLVISDYSSSYIMVSTKKLGTAKVTVEGTYGTVLTLNIHVVANVIDLYDTSLVLLVGAEEKIDVVNHSYDDYIDEKIESAESSDSNILMISDYTTSYVEVSAKKPGTAKVTIEGIYGTVLTVQVKVVSFLEKNSVTVKADNKITVNIDEDRGCGEWDYPYFNHYSVSSSNKNVATGSIVEDEYNGYYVLNIKGINLGNAVITVKDTNNGGSCTISVNVEKPAFSIKETEISFKASEYYYLKSSGSNINTAVSSNTSVFTTEKTGDRTIRLKPVKPGKATVTVSNKFGEVKKATVTVTTFLKLKSIVLTAGNERELSEDVIFNDDSYWEWGKKFTSSNENIASVIGPVYDDSYCFIGEYPGKTTITVRCGKTGATLPIAVTVKAPAFNLNASKLTIDKVKTWYILASGSDIGKVSSSNTKILKIETVNSKRVKLIPVAHGTATVTFTSIYGVKRTASVAVSYNYFKALLTNKTRTGTMLYGYTVLRGTTAPSATVSVRIGGKTYTARADSSGIYKIQSIPVLRYGTNLKLTYKLCGTSITKTVNVGKGKSYISSPYVYKDSTKIPVTVNNAHIGDKIVISIGGKQYTKTIGKAYSRTTITVPINKPNKYGIKMTIALNNKFNQSLASYSAYVYLRSMVRIGDTKDIVKWIPRWNNPSEKDVYSYGESWWYENWMGNEDSNASLSFDENGKVDDWSIYNY